MGEGWEGRVTSLLCLARWARGMQGEILPLGIVVVAGSAGENLEWDVFFCLSVAISMSISLSGLKWGPRLN